MVTHKNKIYTSRQIGDTAESKASMNKYNEVRERNIIKFCATIIHSIGSQGFTKIKGVGELRRSLNPQVDLHKIRMKASWTLKLH